MEHCTTHLQQLTELMVVEATDFVFPKVLFQERGVKIKWTVLVYGCGADDLFKVGCPEQRQDTGKTLSSHPLKLQTPSYTPTHSTPSHIHARTRHLPNDMVPKLPTSKSLKATWLIASGEHRSPSNMRNSANEMRLHIESCVRAKWCVGVQKKKN